MNPSARSRRRPARLLTLAVGLAAAIVLVAGAQADTTISTVPSWNGISGVGLFGDPPVGVSTFGQTIAGNGIQLASFSFWLNLPTTVVFHPAVYEWDGSKATTQLWLGGATSEPAGSGYRQMTFTPPAGVVLQSGKEYVLLLTTLGESGSGSGNWGLVTPSAYSGGGLVYQIAAPPYVLSKLNALWGIDLISQFDLAFTAVFGSSSTPDHLGYCAVAGNTWPDGTAISPGKFLELLVDQPKVDTHYTGATPANFIQGVGITCDSPPAGYVQQGFAGDAQHVPAGYYPYYVPAA